MKRRTKMCDKPVEKTYVDFCPICDTFHYMIWNGERLICPDHPNCLICSADDFKGPEKLNQPLLLERWGESLYLNATEKIEAEDMKERIGDFLGYGNQISRNYSAKDLEKKLNLHIGDLVMVDIGDGIEILQAVDWMHAQLDIGYRNPYPREIAEYLKEKKN